MAAHPIVVVDHGRVEIPEDLQNDPRFSDGAQLQLVPVDSDASSNADAWDNFMKLQGILAHSDFDPNHALELEKKRELEAEERWRKG